MPKVGLWQWVWPNAGSDVEQSNAPLAVAPCEAAWSSVVTRAVFALVRKRKSSTNNAAGNRRADPLIGVVDCGRIFIEPSEANRSSATVDYHWRGFALIRIKVLAPILTKGMHFQCSPIHAFSLQIGRRTCVRV